MERIVPLARGDMPNALARGSRGKYSRLICLQCRARKIRCLLPDENSIQPSGQPQPASKACQRCRQNVFPCIVDATVLGRPRMRNTNVPSPCSHTTENEIKVCRTIATELPPADVEDFMFVRPGGAGHAEKRPSVVSKPDVLNSLLSPAHLLCALLARDQTFLRSTPADGFAYNLQDSHVRLTDVVSIEVTTLLDEK